MKIFFDGRGINWYKGTGIGTYTDNLLRQLIQISSEDFYNIYWWGTDYQRMKFSNSNIVLTSKRHHNFFEKYYIPTDIERNSGDIYHVPQNGIGLANCMNCKKVITIHDLIPYILPETVGKGYLTKFLKEVPYSIEISDAIITVSEWSKKDILRLFPIDENKVHVTPLSADEIYKPMDREKCKEILKNNFNISKPFILYLGGFSPRKNVTALVIAFEKIFAKLNKEYNLVIVGGNSDQYKSILDLSRNSCCSSNIIFTGYVDNSLLPIFYNGCETFVYPSIYEGFGLPPLEAMSCGIPVIASNRSSIPEVVGNAGILVDPFNINELIDAIEKLLSSESLKSEFSNKSIERAKLFSWKNTAEKTLSVYRSLK